jgi:small subunit ribosomal protein S20
MANKKSSKKRIRQTARRTLVNTKTNSKVKTAVRKAREAISTQKDVAPRVTAAIAALQKAANKGVIHKRTAARKASRLAKQANKASAAN